MILILLNALLLQGPVGIAPVNVTDDEIVWVLNAERRFWEQTVRRASRSPSVQGFVDRYGVGSVCNSFENLRGRIVARHFFLYREAVVRLARQQVDPGKLYEAVEAGREGASRKIGESEFDRLMRLVDEDGALGPVRASDELQTRMRNNYSEYVERWGLGRRARDRPNQEGMARLRKEPDLLLTWCVASPQTREQWVGGFMKEED